METHRQHFFRKMGIPESHLSLKELSLLTQVPLSALQQVFDRGIGAWKTNPQSVRLKKTFRKNPNMGKYPRSARLTKEQWAFARVYSFLDKGKTFYTADADIAKNVSF